MADLRARAQRFIDQADSRTAPASSTWSRTPGTCGRRWPGSATPLGRSAAGARSDAASGTSGGCVGSSRSGDGFPVVTPCSSRRPRRPYGDAPRYLYERLIRREHGLKIIWSSSTTLRLSTTPPPRSTRRATTGSSGGRGTGSTTRTSRPTWRPSARASCRPGTARRSSGCSTTWTPCSVATPATSSGPPGSPRTGPRWSPQPVRLGLLPQRVPL